MDTVLERLLSARQYTMTGLEVRVLGAERQDLRLVVEYKGNPQIVERDHLGYDVGMLLGEVHGGIAAIGMSNQCEMSVVHIGLSAFQFAKHEQDIGFAFW